MTYIHYYTNTNQLNTIATCYTIVFFGSKNAQTVYFCVILLKETTALRKLLQ